MAYGDNRDNKKIDLYWKQGGYICSTTWAKSLQQAIQKYAESKCVSASLLSAHYSDKN